jgi:hypothetical protein
VVGGEGTFEWEEEVGETGEEGSVGGKGTLEVVMG